MFVCMHFLMRDERRKEERTKQGQTNNKAKQHSTPKVHDVHMCELGTLGCVGRVG